MTKRLAFLIALSALVLGFALITFLLPARPAASQTYLPAPSHVESFQSTAPTEIEVYVLAKGGKFIGDDIGGAQVTLHDAITGEFLASGRTRGGSGAADMMAVETARTTPISTQDAAVFTTTLALSEPRLIQVEAFAPLGAQGSEHRVSATQWVVPQTVGENKIIIEVPGLNVEVVNPPTHFLPQTKPPLAIQFRVNVTMICGCPIGPGFPWKPENYAVKALIHKPDGTTDALDLPYDASAADKEPSQFVGTYTATQSGVYDAVVIANQAGQDNSGSDRVTFILP